MRSPHTFVKSAQQRLSPARLSPARNAFPRTPPRSAGGAHAFATGARGPTMGITRCGCGGFVALLGACLIVSALLAWTHRPSSALFLRGTRGKVTSRLLAILNKHSPALEQLASTDQRVASAVEAAIDAALSWESEATDDTTKLCSVDATVGCSFGAGPGPSGPLGQQNYALATSAYKVMKVCGGKDKAPPLFLQWEIADALRETRNVTAAFRVAIPPDKDYISTYDVVQACAAELRKKRVPVKGTKPRVALVAHPDHAWRVAALAKAAGWEPVVVGGSLAPDWAAYGCDANGYTEDSMQPWTRDRPAFVAHELWARAKEIADGNIR